MEISKRVEQGGFLWAKSEGVGSGLSWEMARSWSLEETMILRSHICMAELDEQVGFWGRAWMPVGSKVPARWHRMSFQEIHLHGIPRPFRV
jgi:hypothetical protein